jgi:CheY-like chemotaxis protein
VENSVSGRHCEVRVRGEELAVRDLLSTNGTFIGGQKITEGVVKPGQTLRLGEVELRFESSAPGTLSGAPFNSKMLFTSAAATAPKPAAVPEKKPVSAPVPDGGPGKKFHVLFVDDSMAFLELFSGLCAELAKGSWQIYTAASADLALARLQERPVDLVVLDIGMPMLDGLQLLGIINRRYPGLKLAVLTGSPTDSKRADALSKGAELFLEKPVTADGMKTAFNVLNDLVSWNREGFTGALRQVGLQEVIQMECNRRHSAILEIHNPELSGRVYLEAGSITHAVVGTLTGEPAFRRLLSLTGGDFQLKPFVAPPQRTIESGWEYLLLDAARANDEETVMLKIPDAKPEATPAAAPPPDNQETLSPDAEFIVVATYDGKWKPEDDQQK